MRYSGKIILLMLLSFCTCGAVEKKETKKLIYSGSAVPAFLKQFQRSGTALEKNFPFDGLIIQPVLEIERNGKKVFYDSGKINTKALEKLRLQSEDILEWQKTFARLKFKKLKYNFIRTTAAAFSADWFDEQAWQRSLEHYVMLARLAQQTGCKGLVLDAAPWKMRQESPFAFRPLQKRSISEVRNKAKQRGKEWINAVARAYPGIELMCPFWLNGLDSAFHEGTLALFADFASGVVEGAPETVSIIDGSGFLERPLSSFYRPAADFYLAGKKYIPKEKQARFFKTSSLAQILDLKYYKNKGRLLQKDLFHSWNTTDRYILLEGPFAPFPYFKEILLAGCRPLEAARKFTQQKNLLYNGKLASCPPAGKAEPDTHYFGAGGWFGWLDHRKKQGSFTLVKEGVCFKGVSKGSIVQAVYKVPPCGLFLLTGKARVRSLFLQPQLSCNFRNMKNQFMRQHKVTASFGQPDASGWCHAAALVEIPAGMKYMTVTASVSGGRLTAGPADVCCFADIKLQQVIFPWNIPNGHPKK